MESTHIITPAGYEQTRICTHIPSPEFIAINPSITKTKHWIESRHIGLDFVQTGPLCEDPSDAIAAWNSLHSKAPVQYTDSPKRGDL